MARGRPFPKLARGARDYRCFANPVVLFVPLLVLNICLRQIGQGPSFASAPKITVTGPITTVFFCTVSFTVAVTVTVFPSSRPVNLAGTDGPTAIGKARSM